MKRLRFIPTLVLLLLLGAAVTAADAQGKGKGQGTDKPNPSQGRGGEKPAKGPVASPTAGGASKVKQSSPSENRSQARVSGNRSNGSVSSNRLPASANASPRASVAAAPNRGRDVSRYARDLRVSEVRPAARRYVISNRPAEFMTGGAIAYAFARGVPENAYLITPSNRVVAIRNRRGDLLLAMDDDRARTLGVWQVAPLDDRVKGGAPSFCRSGQGHPVWGRQWCLDKGFGLGPQQDVRWGTTRDIGDIIFGRRPSSAILTRDVLAGLLGNVAFDRLALHALTLGYTDPLTGRWQSEATGQDVLFVNSGRYPVAEFVDSNRDRRADLMLVALRPW